MSTRYRVKRGDTPGMIRGTCIDAAGPVDISTASEALLIIRGRNATEPKVNTAVQITDDGTIPNRGRWAYTWQATDLDTAGGYDLELEVRWPSGDRITFPTEGHDELIIESDLA